MWAPTKEEKAILIKALETMVCFIETGSPNLRACDVANGRSGTEEREATLKELDAYQTHLVKRSEQLIESLKKNSDPHQGRGGKLSDSEYRELCVLQSEHRVCSTADRTNLMTPDKVSRMLELKGRFEAFGRAVPSTRD